MSDEIVSKKPSKPQSSRKGKKAWRKNIDIEDIEKNLQEKRDEEIIKGKDSGDLNDDFIIDDQPSILASSKAPKKLKSKEILTNKSKIAALNHSKHQPAKDSHKIQGVKKTDLLRLIKLNGGKFKSESKLMNRLDQDGLVKSKAKDLWDDEEEDEEEKIPKYIKSTAEVTKATVVPKTLKTESIKITTNELTSKSVHAGKSYNPSLESWKELINQEYDAEYRQELARQQIAEHRKRIQELMVTLEDTIIDGSDDDEDEEEAEAVADKEESEKDYSLSINKPNKIKIKTKTKRNREAKHKERVKLQEEIKELKKKMKDLSNLDDILQKQIEKDQEEPSQKKRKRRDKLFKYSPVETPLEVKLSDELSGNLKNLKPEGNLFYDQMLNLQSSGKIESRVPVAKKRKYGKKVTEKWSYKDFK
ncbi:NOP53 Ribosome biogenesis protein NOP53 [Candida maltosa Xu316]|uniref:Ribosome biogenesis protein NOP53 n=1 Tax=Candida maltosa (strain Xu316) TaxID=1245528 RepID=M3K744_CANMX|nr:Ribosomal biogenesis protein, putative [Candida maltosa Xu316]